MYSLMMVIIANTIITFIIKISENKKTNRNNVTLINYIIGSIAALVLSSESLFNTSFDKNIIFVIFLGIFNAFLMTSCMLIQQKSISENGAGLSTMYNRLGILIPTLLSIFILSEKPSVFNYFGIALAVFAIIYSYKKEDEINNCTKNYHLLYAILVLGGIIDFNSKLFSTFANLEYKGLYTLTSFFVSGVIMLIIVLKKESKITRKDIFYGVGIGLPNVFITFGMVLAASKLPAYLVFPAYGGSVIILVNLLDALIFKAKLSSREWYTTLIIVTALIMINL